MSPPELPDVIVKEVNLNKTKPRKTFSEKSKRFPTSQIYHPHDQENKTSSTRYKNNGSHGRVNQNKTSTSLKLKERNNPQMSQCLSRLMKPLRKDIIFKKQVEEERRRQAKRNRGRSISPKRKEKRYTDEEKTKIRSTSAGKSLPSIKTPQHQKTNLEKKKNQSTSFEPSQKSYIQRSNNFSSSKNLNENVIKSKCNADTGSKVKSSKKKQPHTREEKERRRQEIYAMNRIAKVLEEKKWRMFASGQDKNMNVYV